MKPGWRKFDMESPDKYVSCELSELKGFLRPLFTIEPAIVWDWGAFPFELGRSAQEDEPPFKFSFNPSIAEYWKKNKEDSAKLLCHVVAHEFYHVYAGLKEKAWYSESAASRFATRFCDVTVRERNSIEAEIIPKEELRMERAYWREFFKAPEKPPEIPLELKRKYDTLYRKYAGVRRV